MNEQPPNEKEISLITKLEALLFVAPSSVTASQLASVLDTTSRKIETGLKDLQARYNDPKQERGIRLQQHRGRIRLVSIPESAPWVEELLGLEITTRLSRAALETLAIVAYLEPVTRPQVDVIRGVNSDSVLKSLLNKGLIQEIGRADSPGRPILYSTTEDFLSHFGLSSLKELPPLELEGEPDKKDEEEQKIPDDH